MFVMELLVVANSKPSLVCFFFFLHNTSTITTPITTIKIVTATTIPIIREIKLKDEPVVPAVSIVSMASTVSIVLIVPVVSVVLIVPIVSVVIIVPVVSVVLIAPVVSVVSVVTFPE